MAQLRHPITGALYTLQEDGLVEVDNNGLKGLFTFDGAHVSGELRMADLHMLLWLGGPQLPDGEDNRRHRG
ncbi:MAG: transposase [Gammaproteobacteria bacterium]|nr:transposase [Gammaproteobacteria bacterium]